MCSGYSCWYLVLSNPGAWFFLSCTAEHFKGYQYSSTFARDTFKGHVTEEDGFYSCRYHFVQSKYIQFGTPAKYFSNKNSRYEPPRGNYSKNTPLGTRRIKAKHSACFEHMTSGLGGLCSTLCYN